MNNPVITMSELSSSGTFFDKLVWLTSKEAAEYLRKSIGALRVHVHRGHIQVHKWHRRLYFKRVDLDRMLVTQSPSQGGF